VRSRRVAETRERIIDAGSALAHSYASWDWRELTFRAVAERAGVGERTVYRHFPTERHLHEAVMKRLEEEAGIDYETVDLANLTEVTARVFATLHSFAAKDSVRLPDDPTFEAVDQQRQAALLRSVTAAAPHWTEAEQQTAAGLLDILWNLPSFERLVSSWNLDGDHATRAVSWLMTLVLQAIADDERPPT
jgi:AcrR family transcriptional regulator